MRIHRLRLADYRGVAAREVRFAERGVTVVQGPNEAGKSSLAEALDLLLEHYDDSRKASVRATKPVDADVGTEVEAELSAGPYRFTYAKRFHRDRFTTLTVHEPRPEHLTGREAHDRVRQILSETVDLALWRALRIVQGQAVEQPDLSGVSALASALDLAAGGALAGAPSGEREHTLLDRAQAEYLRYFTPTGQDNAWFKGVRAELDDAEREAADARRALSGLEQDIEEAARIARELESMRPEHERHLARLRELEGQWSALRRRVTEVDALALRAERADETWRSTERMGAERAELAQALSTSAQRAQALVTERDALQPALREATQEEQRLQARTAELRGALAEAREAERAAITAEARSKEAFSLELLQERLGRVEAARAQAAEARPVLEDTALDEEGVARIEQAQLALAQAQARLEDAGPVLRLLAHEPSAIQLDGRPLELGAGEQRELPVTEQLSLRVGGMEAVLSPGQGLGAMRERLSEAERAYRDACSRLGVADLAEARAALRRREHAERSLAEAERTLRDNLRDLSPDELADKVARLRERLSASAEAPDVDAAKESREAAERRVRDLDTELAEAENALGEAAARRTAMAERQIALAVRLEQALQEREDAEAALHRARELIADESLEGKAAALAAEAREAAEALATARTALAAEDPDTVQAAVENARELDAKQRQALREREDELTKLRGRLSALGEVGLHDRVAAAETRAERARAAWRQADRGAVAARRLYDTLLEHREAARRAYVAPLRDKLESLGRIVFGPDFAVELDDELRTVRRTLGGLTLDVDQLSTGAREQLAVLSRLAVAAITAEDGGVPVLLDDALGWSDPARLERMGAAFHIAARDSQVIVLTCVPERYAGIGSATTVRL